MASQLSGVQAREHRDSRVLSCRTDSIVVDTRPTMAMEAVGPCQAPATRIAAWMSAVTDRVQNLFVWYTITKGWSRVMPYALSSNAQAWRTSDRHRARRVSSAMTDNRAGAACLYGRSSGSNSSSASDRNRATSSDAMRRTAHISLRRPRWRRTMSLLKRLFPSLRASSVVAVDHLGVADALDKLTVLDIKIGHETDDGAREALREKRERLAARLPTGETEKPAVEQLRLVNEELFFSEMEMEGAIMAEASDTTVANIAKRIQTLKELRVAIKANLESASV